MLRQRVVATGYLHFDAGVVDGAREQRRLPDHAYTVRVASPAGNTATCATVSATMCVITGLLPAHELHVHGGGDERRRHLGGLGSVSRQADGPPPATGMVPRAIPCRTCLAQTPIIDFALTTATPVGCHVPGYVSIPQGRFRVSNPNGSRRRTQRRSAGGLVRHRTIRPCARADRPREPDRPAHVQDRLGDHERVSAHGVERDRPDQPGRRLGDQLLGSPGRLDRVHPLSAGASSSPARSWAA